MTPFNAVAGCILLAGLPVIAYRYVYGLGLQPTCRRPIPGGSWIGFDILCGVALAGRRLHTGKHRISVRPQAVLPGVCGPRCNGISRLLFRAWWGSWSISVGLGASRTRSSTPMASRQSCSWWPGACSSISRCCSSSSVLPFRVAWLEERPQTGVETDHRRDGARSRPLHLAPVGAGSAVSDRARKLHPLWYSPLIPVYFFISISLRASRW